MFLLVPDGAGENGHSRLSVNFALLPGVALVATIMLPLLFVIAAVTTPGRTDEVPTGVSAHKPSKPNKSPGRPKKTESEHPPAPQKPSKKRKNEVKVSSPDERGATN